jgi:signal transduction histidine kinase
MSAPAPRRRRLGLRREMVILLPAATLVLLALAATTLLAYRGAVDLLVSERQSAAARLAHTLAIDQVKSPQASVDALRLHALQALGVAILGSRGEPLTVAGVLAGEETAELPELSRLPGPVGLGPDARFPDAVVGIAPFGPPQARRYLRVDLPATPLAAQRRSVRLFSYIVFGTGGGIALVVLLFLRSLLAPYEALLARARQAGEAEGDDEVAFLLSTFERALAALARPSTAAPDDDIAALERTLARSLDSGLLLLDREGRILALNPTGQELLGVAAPAAAAPLGEGLAAHAPLAGLLRDTVASARGFQRRECSIERRGERRVLGLTAHPLRRDDGGVGGFLVLFADLTEVQRHEADDRLAESLSRLGELAAGVAHELRNSLATLRGYLTLIERRPPGESADDYLSEIRRETDQLQRVLEDFLAFARPGSARLETVEVEALLRRAAADPALDGAPVAVRGGFPGLRMRADPQLLERALRNLLHNAALAQREAGAPGPVEATAARTAGGLEIAIDDRGPGLPPEVRERLFQPFAAGRAGGVGLGLALAQRIAQLHGGRLRLEERPGGGTRALLEFPVEVLVG